MLTSASEGIKYAGSKRAVIPAILRIISRLPVKTVLDGFAGTTRVGQALAANGYHVLSNDVSAWSRVFGQCYLLNDKPPSYFQPFLDHLNALPGEKGWFTENYGGSGESSFSDTGDGRKKIWQIHNTEKLDAIRSEIDRLPVSETERSVLLTSLILAMDRVDSTVGHQVSYLRHWARRAFRTMNMTCPQLIPCRPGNAVFQSDIQDLLPRLTADLAYFDPPYGSANEKMPPSRVRYASYYHLWTSICLHDQPPLRGVAGRRVDSSDRVAASVFEEYRRNPETGRYIALEAIESIIRSARTDFILLSYSNQGRATRTGLVELITSLGYDYRVFEKKHRDHVMRGMQWTKDWVTADADSVTEYLFLISKNGKLTGFDDFRFIG